MILYYQFHSAITQNYPETIMAMLTNFRLRSTKSKLAKTFVAEQTNLWLPKPAKPKLPNKQLPLHLTDFPCSPTHMLQSYVKPQSVAKKKKEKWGKKCQVCTVKVHCRFLGANRSLLWKIPRNKKMAAKNRGNTSTFY